MDDTVTTGSKVAVLGDFRTGYVISDVLGGSLEVVQHLFGTANLRPIGARGFYYWWRTGGGVVNANAFRYLEIK